MADRRRPSAQGLELESDVVPLPDRVGAPDRIAEQIREAIYQGRYLPGERLVERKLAAELGVSHIPVREALVRLAEDGLVVRLPRRGSRVAALTPAELEEISSVRVVLEQFAVERVLEGWTHAAEQELRGLVARMIDAAEAKDVRAMLDLDSQLHERLWALAGHAILNELVLQLRGRINGFLRAATIALEPPALLAHARSHEELVDAIASGDAARARDAVQRHVVAAERRVRDSLENAIALRG